ncbi:MAG: serine/threonine protein kinase [Bacteroidales bacterium]|nr:serine/threonine protein kinase [Bacteroidales bacterium]
MQLKANSLLQSGKYRIIRLLGQGGFGITYLAENTMLGKQVAIKEFFPKDFCGRDNTSHLTLGTQNNADTVSKLKARFIKEAQNIAKLDHPGIVHIHDIFEENNTAYYVMDYIDGENLNEIVKHNGPLPEGKAVKYVEKVGEALEYIHSRNMTHFDVKPANIVIRKKDDQPILIDFGLSKQYDAHGDATSTLMQGISQGYSPIELYNYGSVSTFSPQTDVYSLGATLLYLVSGKVPPQPSSIIENGLELSFVGDPKLRKAIESSMQVGRGKRPASMRKFLNSLTNIEQNQEKAYPSQSSYQDSNDDSTRIIQPLRPTTKDSVQVYDDDKVPDTVSRKLLHNKIKTKATKKESSWVPPLITFGFFASILFIFSIAGNCNSGGVMDEYDYAFDTAVEEILYDTVYVVECDSLADYVLADSAR